jgi:hypothetical protein
LIAVALHPPLNTIHNPNLESVHYELATKFSSHIAADMFSSISVNKITTIGFDVRHRSLYDVNEIAQLKRLGVILASQSFSGLSRILVRFEYEWQYAPSAQLENPALSERNMAYSLNVIHDAFQFARARGILELEHLTYQRRRDITDDCFPAKIFSRAPITP